jgi:hypothetical protein
METQIHKILSRIIAVFVGLMLVAAILVVAGSLSGPGFTQLALLSIGAAIMSGSLAFFLVGIFWWTYREQTNR